MSIKGLKEALAKKQAQQHAEPRTAGTAASTAELTTKPVARKPRKKVTGRGR